jgi:hypothetical protein
MIVTSAPPGTFSATLVVSGDTALKSVPRMPPRLCPT